MDETMTEQTLAHAPVRRPPGAGVDLDPSRRPGVPKMHAPAPLPHTHYPPERQRSDVTVFMRRGKALPPVFGTAVPPRGLAGLVRKAAYTYPDHAMRHWTMLLLADRVDLWEHRARKVTRVAAPALALLALAAGLRSRARR
jgi:hypothetical protein